MRPSIPACALLFVLAALAACKKPVTAADPLDVVPASSSAVVFGPSLVGATAQLKALIGRLEATGATQRTTSASDDLTQRVGFDLFTTEGLAGAGFKPDGPFVIALGAEGAGNTLFLPIADGDKALASLEKFARQAEQADRIKEVKAGELTIKSFARPFGSREVPVMSAAVHGPFLVVARGPRAVEMITQAVQLKREASFSQSPVMKALGTRVPATPIRFVVDASRASSISKDAKAAERLVKFLAGGFTPSADGLDVTVVAELADEKRDAVLQSLFPKGATLPLSSVLDGDVVAAGQGTLALDAARTVATSVDPGSVDALRKQAARFGLGMEEELMAMTDGHYAGALYMAPTTEVSAAFKEGKPVNQQLMRLLPFVLMMRPGNGKTPAQLVDFLKSRFTQRGMSVDVLDGEPGTLHATWPGQAGWRSYQAAVVEGTLLVGGGSPEKFRASLKKLREKTAPVTLDDGTSALLMRPETSTLVVRLPAFAARLAEVAKADLGEGADALMARTLVNRVRQIASVGQVFTLELRPGGQQLHGSIHLPLQKAAP